MIEAFYHAWQWFCTDWHWLVLWVFVVIVRALP